MSSKHVTRGFALLASAVAACLAGAVQAHHSFAAEFDESREMTVSGVLTKVDWINPHSYCYVDVKNANGTTTRWAFEGFPPAMMKRLGFSRETLVSNVGKIVKVSYNPAHSADAKLGYGRIYEFEGGQKIVFTPPSNSEAGGKY